MATTYNSNLINVVQQYLRVLKIPFTTGALSQQLEQNPYYPSLYSINDVLSKYNIPNQVLEVDKEQFDKIPLPFIAFCKGLPTGKDFVLVTAVTPNNVTYLSESKKAITVAKKEFLRDWERIILIAEADVQSGEPKYEEHAKKERQKKNKRKALIAGAFAIVALLVTSFFIQASDTLGALLPLAASVTITKLLGTAIALLLLQYEMDKSNSFLKDLCTGGKQVNCDAVLNSDAAGIAGIKWSEIGLFYFSATLLFLFYPGIGFEQKVPWLGAAAFAAAPYIVFSIYYQYQKVKQWCLLCLAVQAILLLECTWAIFAWRSLPAWSFAGTGVILAIALCILLPVVTWYVLKPVLQAAKDERIYQAAYKRQLYNPDFFNQLLLQQQEAPDGWQAMGINIGNPAAANTILKVCSPYCGPCGAAHPVLEEIIEHNNDVNLKVIFTATNDAADKGGVVAKHLLGVAAAGNAVLTQQMLDDWYSEGKKDFAAFGTKYPVENSAAPEWKEKMVGIVNTMSAWCKEAGITHTPTIFINGRRLPDSYRIEELRHIL